MPQFRKKPVVIEAVKWEASRQSWDQIIALGCPTKPGPIGGKEFTIPTLEGDMTVSDGDYVIRGVKGEFYPCKPDIFEATYDKV